MNVSRGRPSPARPPSRDRSASRAKGGSDAWGHSWIIENTAPSPCNLPLTCPLCCSFPVARPLPYTLPASRPLACSHPHTLEILSEPWSNNSITDFPPNWKSKMYFLFRELPWRGNAGTHDCFKIVVFQYVTHEMFCSFSIWILRIIRNFMSVNITTEYILIITSVSYF